MAKQIMNVRDVMAVLEVSESKAYGIIRKLNSELAEKNYIVIPGKIPAIFSGAVLWNARRIENHCLL